MHRHRGKELGQKITQLQNQVEEAGRQKASDDAQIEKLESDLESANQNLLK